MKIVYMYPELSSIGGADRIIIQKANYLAEQMGYEVYILTDSQGDKPISFPLSHKVTHIDLDIPFNKQYQYPILVRIIYYSILMRQYRKVLSTLLNKIHPDITISTLSRNSDFLTKIKDGSKKIGEAHTTRTNLRNMQELINKGGIYRIAGLFLKQKVDKTIKKLDAFVVLNKYEQKAWSSLRKALIIPNSLPFFPNTTGLLTARKVILIGRLEYEKGIDKAINIWEEVARKYPDWILEIYGNGTLKEELIQLIKNKKMERNIIIKPPTQNILPIYLESSILLLTSRYEGLPMVLLEAMACGLPCIAYDCPFGPRSIINNEVNGFLIADNQKEEMVNKLCQLIESNSLRRQIGYEARRHIVDYSQEKVMKQWNDLFNTLIKSKE